MKLTSKVLTGPVYWLAQGNVTIAGVIDLNGENGHPASDLASDRLPAAGGAGGYSGGLGGSASISPTPGNGPGGSAATTTNSAAGVPQFGGAFAGSQYLIPLSGGSGGGGGFFRDVSECKAFGPGGGAGGGAILIASSVSITLADTGKITAVGGNSGFGGSYLGSVGLACSPQVPGGSGGAVRLMAPTIALPSAIAIDARGGSSLGENGIVRLEAFTYSRDFPSGDVQGRLSTSPPFTVVPPPTVPPSSIKVTSINGVSINANPFNFPDTTINSTVPVTVNVQAKYIPVGTVPKIIVMSETGPDQTVNCSALAGTLALSTCAAQITFPTGGSRGFVKATWQ